MDIPIYRVWIGDGVWYLARGEAEAVWCGTQAETTRIERVSTLWFLALAARTARPA